MGQGESQPTQDRALQANGGVAFHVLRVAELSPAADAGIDPFFDFICGVNGSHLGNEIDALTQVLEENEGGTVTLQVWSTKRKELRDVDVVPSREWSTKGHQPPDKNAPPPSLLGLSLRVCHPAAALEQVWHVLEILEGSPAQSAGLVPFGDWIVGYAGGVLRGEGDFYDVVEAHVDKPLRLFVYNADYDVTREAILVPNRSWGGEGLLGCGVGYGLLHRIPKPQDGKPPPDEYPTDSEDERFDQNNLPSRRTASSSSASRPTGGRAAGSVGSNRHASSGFAEAVYERDPHAGAYDATEGVEVIPIGQEDTTPSQGGFETFVPADDFSTKGSPARAPMKVQPGSGSSPGGRAYGSPYSAKRSSAHYGVSEAIREEDDENELV